MPPTATSNFDILPFATPKHWQHWLSKNHATTPGIWIRFYKKTSNIPTVSYDEVLLAALCYGWIDGQIKGHDEHSWIHKFTRAAQRACGPNEIAASPRT